MNVVKSILPALLLFTVTASVPGAARADTLDEILQVLNTAGIVDQAVVEAKPMIQCLIDGKPIEQCAEIAGAEAKGLIPNDPKIQKVVDVFHAVQAGDWLRVFVLTGEQVVCTLVPGDPYSDLFCGPIFDVAEPVITSAYAAVRDGEILKLVTLLGVDYACQLLPNVSGAGALCEFLGEIVAGIAKGVGDAVGALGNLLEDVSGQTPHMPVEQYYVTQWRSWLHYAVLQKLRTGQVAYLHAGRYGGTPCAEYFDSHKMSASNAEKVCGIMKQRFLDEVEEVAELFAAFPPAYFQGAGAPNVGAWASQYYQNIPTTPVPATSPPDTPGHWIKTYLTKPAPQPFQQVLMHCLGQTPLPLPPVPGTNDGVSAADQSILGIAQGWACTQVYGLLAAALQKQKAIVDGVSGKIASLGCQKSGNAPALHFSCPTYAAFRQCRALYPHGSTTKDSLCWVNQYKADPALAQQVASELGPKRCSAIDKPGASPFKNVQCLRPWKQTKCKSLVATYSEGAPNPPNFACVARVESGFVAGKQKVKTLLASINPPRARPLCTTARENEWDPLRVACTDPEASKKVKAKLPTCLSDANQDGADAPCYDGPLSDDTKPAPVAQPVGPQAPPDVQIIDVQLTYYRREGRAWAATRAPTRGAMFALRCTYAITPEARVVDWSIAFMEGERLLDRAAGPGPFDPATGQIARTWYGTLIEPGPVDLGCVADPNGELAESNEGNNRVTRRIEVSGGQRVAPAPPGERLRVARVPTSQAATVRGKPPALDLAFASFAGVKRANAPGGVRDAPPVTTATAGEPLVVDCSYVVYMDAPNGEPVETAAWSGQIELQGQTVKQAAGDTRLVSSHGTSNPVTLQHRFSPPKAGSYSVRCQLDTAASLAETDETNNTASFTLEVQAGRSRP
jgi:hypothetical protein